MPAYQCRDCETVFKSKSALADHRDECGGETGETAFDNLVQRISGVSVPLSVRGIRNALTLRNAALAFGVLMMATLFLGTASFMTSTAPTQSGPTGAVTAETNPALGYSIRTERDIPQLSGSEQPSLVSNQPLSVKQQLWAITQGGQGGAPAAIIHYNCETGCPELVNNLTGFAENYGGWVYVAPNPEISSTIAVTGYRRIQRYDEFDPEQAHGFVCTVLQNRPIACVTG